MVCFARWGANYMDDFSKHKIVYIEIMTDNPEEGYKFPSFSFDDQGCVLLNTAYMITGNADELKYILSILNSKLGRQLVKYYVTQLQNRQFRMLHQSVINFPIPLISNNKELYAQIAENIQYSKNTDVENQLSKLNKMIYQLYKLNNEEIEFIEIQ
ncbi:hypothetical protein EZS27_039170 [termite gut metagenome]|uniref:site-specific DNA-methyltransferase (adenine-specific) n=1 Tax=termite gut metagenome TaxID=433724 RepID=A0A5J4PKD3_9ZZZZ